MKKVKYLTIILIMLLILGCSKYPKYYSEISLSDGFEYVLSSEVKKNEIKDKEVYCEVKMKDGSLIISHLVNENLQGKSFWGDEVAFIKILQKETEKCIEFYDSDSALINNDFISTMNLLKNSNKYYFQLVDNAYVSIIPNDVIVSKNKKEKLQIVLFKGDENNYLNINKDASMSQSVKNIDELYNAMFENENNFTMLLSLKMYGMEGNFIKGENESFENEGIRLEYLPVTLKMVGSFGITKYKYYYLYLIKNKKNKQEMVFVGSMGGLDSKLTENQIEDVFTMLKTLIFVD